MWALWPCGYTKVNQINIHRHFGGEKGCHPSMIFLKITTKRLLINKISSWFHSRSPHRGTEHSSPCGGVNGRADPSNPPSKPGDQSSSPRSDGREQQFATWIQTPRHLPIAAEITKLPLARSLSLLLRRNGQPRPFPQPPARILHPHS